MWCPTERHENDANVLSALCVRYEINENRMETFSVKLIERKDVAEGTMSIRVEKPEGYIFRAGQYVVMTTPNLVEPDVRNGVRSMSIASAPYENDLLFAMRRGTSGFKKTIAALSPGDEIRITAPVGNFTLVREDVRPVAFLVGGIGITPARSILRQADHDGDAREFFLFYSNYRPEDTPFLEELRSFSKLRYHAIFTMTEPERSVCEWNEERGFICESMLTKHLQALTEPRYYLVGAPGFTKAMEGMLAGFGIKKEDITQDPFTGL